MSVEHMSTSLVPESEPEKKVYTLATIQEELEQTHPEDKEYQADIKELCDDIGKYSLNYLDAVLRHRRHSERFTADTFDSNDEKKSRLAQVEEVNSGRTKAHDRLIESMEILARFARKQGMAVSWWDGPTGMKDLHRSVVGEWAMHEACERIRNQEIEKLRKKLSENNEGNTHENTAA